MKISCQSCQAKYTIADEKVLGKIVKIRCRKCGATIVAQGNGAGTNGSASRGPTPPSAFAGDDVQWHVNLGDNDPRTMSLRELIDAFHPQVQWDDEDRASFFRFYRDATREWVYYTDARTFQARYSLVTASGIQGFCSWVLGKEDPAIWDLLPNVR